MPHLRVALVLAAFCLFASVANAQAVTPGQLFSGVLLDIRAPNSDGWKLQETSATGMTFFRPGAANESYVAQVSLFSVPMSQSKDEFVALVKNGFERSSPAERFKSLESKFEYTEERGYSCVRVTALTQDTKAFFGREVLRLQWRSLYCRHPKRQDTGFMIAFSHRGKCLDTEIELTARSFIDGVQVPEFQPVVASNVPRSFVGLFKWRDEKYPVTVELSIERVESAEHVIRIFGSQTYGPNNSRVAIEGQIDAVTHSLNIRELDPSSVSMITDGSLQGTISNDLQIVTAIWTTNVTGRQGDYSVKAKVFK